MVFPDIISEQLSESFAIKFVGCRDGVDLLCEPVHYRQDCIEVLDFLQTRN